MALIDSPSLRLDPSYPWHPLNSLYREYRSGYELFEIRPEDFPESASLISTIQTAAQRTEFQGDKVYVAKLRFNREPDVEGVEMAVMMSGPEALEPGGAYRYRHEILGIINDGRIYNRKELPWLYESTMAKRNERHISLQYRLELYRLSEDDKEVPSLAVQLSDEIWRYHRRTLAFGLMCNKRIPDTNFEILKDIESRSTLSERLQAKYGPRNQEFALIALAGEVEIRFPPLAAEEATSSQAARAVKDLAQLFGTGKTADKVFTTMEPFEVFHKYPGERGMTWAGIVVRCKAEQFEDGTELLDEVYKRLQTFRPLNYRSLLSHRSL